VSRPKTEINESGLQTLLELELIAIQFSHLENKLQDLIDSALENKIPMKRIANATGNSLFRIKYLSEKKRGVR
jgi:hypothetical protein